MFPRFNLKQNYDLIAHLKEMGLTDLFDEGDFSPMTSEKIAINWVRRATRRHRTDHTIGQSSRTTIAQLSLTDGFSATSVLGNT